MRTWTRWQDWVAVAAGLYAALSPLWTTTDAAASGSLIVLGILIIIAALINLAKPRLMVMEWIEVLLGVLLFISPWVLGYSDMTGASITAWIIGAITIIVGVWAATTMAPARAGTDRTAPSTDSTEPPLRP